MSKCHIVGNLMHWLISNAVHVQCPWRYWRHSAPRSLVQRDPINVQLKNYRVVLSLVVRENGCIPMSSCIHIQWVVALSSLTRLCKTVKGTPAYGRRQRSRAPLSRLWIVMFLWYFLPSPIFLCWMTSHCQCPLLVGLGWLHRNLSQTHRIEKVGLYLIL